MDMSEDASGIQNTRTVPTRVCQTCGEAKSLDHFVSMYTEASTTNCDLCRKKQREVYRLKQLKKRKLSITRLRTMTLRSASNNHRTQDIISAQSSPMDYSPSQHPVALSPYSSSSVSNSNSPIMSGVSSNYGMSPCVPCVPSQRWISCWVDAPMNSIYVGRLIVPSFDQQKYSSLYHV